MKLRQYQQETIDKVKAAFARGRRTVLLQLPTGGGKTIISAFMIAGAVSKGNNVLFIVHLKELIEQTCQKLDLLGLDYGVIAADVEPKKASIQVAMVQSLRARLNKNTFLPDFIITDECHHCTSKTYIDIYRHFNRAKLIGLTATPVRTDGTGLGKIYQELVEGPKVKDLIAQGFLSSYKLLGPPNSLDLSNVHHLGGDFKADELATAIESSSIMGDCVKHYKRYLDGKKVITFCLNIRHSIIIRDSFLAAGIKAAHLDGKRTKDERKKVINDFKSGEIQVLCNCSLISEGFDVPDCDGVILLRPTESIGLYLQQIGRALRPQEGKIAIVLDHVGNYKRHGLPDEEREWSLEGADKKRKVKQDDDAIDEYKTSTCLSCFTVFEAHLSVCPECGKKKEIKVKQIKASQGDLVEIKDYHQPVYSTKEKALLVANCHTLKDFQAAAKLLGYKPGWAWHRFKQKKEGNVKTRRD